MGSIPVGSTKTTVKTVVFYFQRRIERLLTQPDSRTLGVLAAIREYQNDREDSRFFTPNGESKDDIRRPDSRRGLDIKY